MHLQDHQERVEEFTEEHDLDAAPGFRLLDLAAEVGEVAADAAKSSDYGRSPEEMAVEDDEIGDALFSLLAVANRFDVDAEAALEAAMEKYRDRIEASGDAGSE